MLYVPPILLDSIEDDVVITTYVEGIESLSKTPFTRKGEMFVETTEAESDLNVLLGNSRSASIDIRVVVKINGKQIYDSSNKLKRDFILFDDINETKASVNPSSNYTLYSRDIDGLGDLDNSVHTLELVIFCQVEREKYFSSKGIGYLLKERMTSYLLETNRILYGIRISEQSIKYLHPK